MYKDHLPKSCQGENISFIPINIQLIPSVEVEEDKKLDARHAIEEAMSERFSRLEMQTLLIGIWVALALMRNCPNCGKGT